MNPIHYLFTFYLLERSKEDWQYTRQTLAARQAARCQTTIMLHWIAQCFEICESHGGICRNVMSKAELTKMGQQVNKDFVPIQCHRSVSGSRIP